MIKSKYKVIAVMSGTSLDGIDIISATFSYFNSWNFIIHHSETVKYSKQWTSILKELVNKSDKELRDIDSTYSAYIGKEIKDFIKRHKISEIDFVASHGHTALHQPEKGLTYQIGNRQVLADILNEKVICDFRVQDVEYDGQGAPLVPIGDRLLFNDYHYCLNLGGFANISFENKSERIAYDICPVNIVLNYYVSKLGLEFDDKGQLASTGKINNELLEQLNQLDFYHEQPPKSLGLEWVELNILPLMESFNLKLEDKLRTFIEHIVIQISNILQLKNSKLLITGGGVYNVFLVSRLKLHTQVKIIIPQAEIIEYKEALIFGILGVLKERNEVNCLKSVTGASHNHSSGKILMPNA